MLLLASTVNCTSLSSRSARSLNTTIQSYHDDDLIQDISEVLEELYVDSVTADPVTASTASRYGFDTHTVPQSTRWAPSRMYNPDLEKLVRASESLEKFSVEARALSRYGTTRKISIINGVVEKVDMLMRQRPEAVDLSQKEIITAIHDQLDYIEGQSTDKQIKKMEDMYMSFIERELIILGAPEIGDMMIQSKEEIIAEIRNRMVIWLTADDAGTDLIDTEQSIRIALDALGNLNRDMGEAAKVVKIDNIMAMLSYMQRLRHIQAGVSTRNICMTIKEELEILKDPETLVDRSHLLEDVKQRLDLLSDVFAGEDGDQTNNVNRNDVFEPAQRLLEVLSGQTKSANAELSSAEKSDNELEQTEIANIPLDPSEKLKAERILKKALHDLHILEESRLMPDTEKMYRSIHRRFESAVVAADTKKCSEIGS